MMNYDAIPAKVNPNIFNGADFRPSPSLTEDQRGKSEHGAVSRTDKVAVPVGELGVLTYNPYEHDDSRILTHAFNDERSTPHEA